MMFDTVSCVFAVRVYRNHVCVSSGCHLVLFCSSRPTRLVCSGENAGSVSAAVIIFVVVRGRPLVSAPESCVVVRMAAVLRVRVERNDPTVAWF